MGESTCYSWPLRSKERFKQAVQCKSGGGFMKSFVKYWAVAGAAFLFAACGFAAPASAQATRTWVSGVGDDANPCSRTAPCKTFAGAISKTATGGEINCIDPGGFGAVTITKSLSILCDTVEAGVLVSGTNAIIVNAPNGTVILSGLDIDGVGTGLNGIRFIAGSALILDNIKIRNFTGYGIDFEPGTSGTSAQLVLKNSILSNNGSTSTTTSGGTLIKPAATVSAAVTIIDSLLANNLNVGFRLETAGSPTAITTSIANTTVSNSGSGILVRALAGNGTIDLTVDSSLIVQNTGYGLITNGAGATMRVGNSTIAANGTGVLILNGAAVTSFGDNRLAGNTTNGAFSATTLKQ